MLQFCEHRNVVGASRSSLALIGVGANLGGPDGRSPLETCRQAVAMLDLFFGLRLIGLSRWFESAPVPRSSQPFYVNAVAALAVDPGTTLDPASLLASLMAIEAACRRRRSNPNAARTLDLDIIGIGSLVREAPDPILPHPRAHLRAFVLAPLMDVAPQWLHPVLRRSAASLLAELPPQEIRPL